MTLRMLDSIEVPNLPPGADAYAGYVDGRFTTWLDLKAKFPHARLLSIAVFPEDDADCLDVETGDATIPEVFDWFTRQRARKVWRPCIYTSASNLTALLATMGANGFARSSYRIWSAHYLAGEHICAPSSCGFPEADGTQWRDDAPGLNGSRVDESLLHHSFFRVPPKPPPPPLPPHAAITAHGDTMFYLPVKAGAELMVPIPVAVLSLSGPVPATVLRVSAPAPVKFEYQAPSGAWEELTVDANRSPQALVLADAAPGRAAIKIRCVDSTVQALGDFA